MFFFGVINAGNELEPPDFKGRGAPKSRLFETLCVSLSGTCAETVGFRPNGENNCGSTILAIGAVDCIGLRFSAVSLDS